MKTVDGRETEESVFLDYSESREPSLSWKRERAKLVADPIKHEK